MLSRVLWYKCATNKYVLTTRSRPELAGRQTGFRPKVSSLYTPTVLSLFPRERGASTVQVYWASAVYTCLCVTVAERLFALRKIHLEQQGVRDGVLALKKQLSIASLRPLTINPDIRNPDPSFPSRL